MINGTGSELKLPRSWRPSVSGRDAARPRSRDVLDWCAASPRGSWRRTGRGGQRWGARGGRPGVAVLSVADEGGRNLSRSVEGPGDGCSRGGRAAVVRRKGRGLCDQARAPRGTQQDPPDPFCKHKQQQKVHAGVITDTESQLTNHSSPLTAVQSQLTNHS